MVMLSQGQLAVCTATHKELTIFAYQIWKSQFLSTTAIRRSLRRFFEMGVYTKTVDSVERARQRQGEYFRIVLDNRDL